MKIFIYMIGNYFIMAHIIAFQTNINTNQKTKTNTNTYTIPDPHADIHVNSSINALVNPSINAPVNPSINAPIHSNNLCLLCLDEINTDTKTDTTNGNIIMTKYCNCKINIHPNCYNQIINNTKLLCPICRIKSTDLIVNSRINEIGIDNSNGNDNDYDIHNNRSYCIFFFEYPLSIFYKYPNIFTFTIWVLYSFLISIIFIVPMLIFYLLRDCKYRNNIILSLLIGTSIIKYFYSGVRLF